MLRTLFQVFRRAIGAAEVALKEQEKVINEKRAHQQRLLEKVRQYIRVHDKQTTQSDDVAMVTASASNDEEDALAEELRTLVTRLREMAASKLQVK